MSSSTKTLTEGPLAKQIFLVSLPLALSNLLQVLFNMSDVAVVGRFAGSTACRATTPAGSEALNACKPCLNLLQNASRSSTLSLSSRKTISMPSLLCV